MIDGLGGLIDGLVCDDVSGLPPRIGDDQWCATHSIIDSATGGIPMMGEGARSHDNLTKDEIHVTLCSHGDSSLDTLAFLSCVESWGLSVDALNNIDPAWYPDHEEAELPAGHREIQSTPPLWSAM
eukprot:2921258-Amphidinium_carterae.1